MSGNSWELMDDWDKEPPEDRSRVDEFDKGVKAAKAAAKNGATPNKSIDDAIRTMMAKVKGKGDDSLPPDVAVKIINTAIMWEKVKHGIRDAENPFNPDDL